MENEKEARRRKVLRMAGDVLEGRCDPKDLEKEGFMIGDLVKIDKKELLREMEQTAPPEKPMVTVTVYEGDFPLERREELEDSLVSALAREDVGKWVGSGSGKIGTKPPFFDVSFIVNDEGKAVATLRLELRRLGVGKNVEIETEGGVQGVYEDEVGEPDATDTSVPTGAC